MQALYAAPHQQSMRRLSCPGIAFLVKACKTQEQDFELVVIGVRRHPGLRLAQALDFLLGGVALGAEGRRKSAFRGAGNEMDLVGADATQDKILRKAANIPALRPDFSP